MVATFVRSFCTLLQIGGKKKRKNLQKKSNEGVKKERKRGIKGVSSDQSVTVQGQCDTNFSN